MIKIPIQKQPLQLAQAESQTVGRINLDKVSMPLDNKWNFAYIGEFFLGSGSPQQVRVLFDTGSANSWILSKESIAKR